MKSCSRRVSLNNQAKKVKTKVEFSIKVSSEKENISYAPRGQGLLKGQILQYSDQRH